MRLAIVVTEYPKTTETFILRDVMKFAGWGADLRLFHLKPRNRNQILHDFAKPTEAFARHPSPAAAAALAGAAVRAGTTLGAASAVVRRQAGEPVLMAKSLGLVLSAAGMARELAEWGCDHIHAEFAGHPATAAWVAHRMTGIPYSVSCRAHDIFRTQRLLAEKLGEAAFVRTVSNFARDFLLERVPGLDPAKMHVIHSSVDLGVIPELGPPPTNPFHVLYVGALQERKGIDVLLRALTRIDIPGWHCSIAGMGPEEAKLKAMAKDLGLSDRVAFLGSQDFAQVSRLYESASVVAVPSVIGPKGRTEGIPNVAIEGLAFHRPVISTRVSGIPELIRHKETGWLIEPGSVEALADAMTEIHADPETAYAVARGGRRFVESEFSLETNARRQFDLFRTHADPRNRAEAAE